MSMCPNHKRTEELPVQVVGEDEPIPGLTSGELMDSPPQISVDPQQSAKVFAQEHPSEPSTRAYRSQTVPMKIQSPIGAAGTAGSSMPSQCLSRVATALGTATHSQDSPWRIYSGSDSGHNLSGAPDESDCTSPNEGGMENGDSSFTIKASESSKLHQEYVDLMNLKENGEIVLVTSMNKMSPTMKDIFLVPKHKSLGKTIEFGNNQAHDKTAAKAATE
ncbi:hypothetical protein M422DRAFT_258933 [Sphaerobolus stellatus SS14]|uniref:Uncharacterized protein n=1 Tax=Sphaerobolus stellatus (strain SS14) TaxID=990650 RepID=A0A0C9U5N6_SPHS4|nr:hypothetical protein M422DRAFT_258933 [Sphaerobolus stellatus SS14]